MREDKYKESGISFAEVQEAFPDIAEYERSLIFYLRDENFQQLQEWIKAEDFNLAMDAVKGLYILASELKIYRLYTALVDVYQDLLYEEYKELSLHSTAVETLHHSLCEVWGC